VLHQHLSAAAEVGVDDLDVRDPEYGVLRDEDVADNFSRLRRVLTLLADHYLSGSRDRWFSPPS
jgi:hypothetical protein